MQLIMDHRYAPDSQSHWGDVLLFVGVHRTNSIRLDNGGDTGPHSRLVYLEGFLIRIVDLGKRDIRLMNVDNLVWAMLGL